jgi:hypothetical protein
MIFSIAIFVGKVIILAWAAFLGWLVSGWLLRALSGFKP